MKENTGTSSSLRLSQLNTGDVFRFEDHQQAIYIVQKNRAQVYQTDRNVEWTVLKKNKTSVVCRPFQSHVEYSFKFCGVLAGYVEGVDCVIEKIG